MFHGSLTGALSKCPARSRNVVEVNGAWRGRDPESFAQLRLWWPISSRFELDTRWTVCAVIVIEALTDEVGARVARTAVDVPASEVRTVGV